MIQACIHDARRTPFSLTVDEPTYGTGKPVSLRITARNHDCGPDLHVSFYGEVVGQPDRGDQLRDYLVALTPESLADLVGEPLAALDAAWTASEDWSSSRWSSLRHACTHASCDFALGVGLVILGFMAAGAALGPSTLAAGGLAAIGGAAGKAAHLGDGDEANSASQKRTVRHLLSLLGSFTPLETIRAFQRRNELYNRTGKSNDACDAQRDALAQKIVRGAWPDLAPGAVTWPTWGGQPWLNAAPTSQG